MNTNDENSGRISIIWLIIPICICLFLGYQNYSLNKKIDTLNSNISTKNSTIKDLKEEISNLNSTILSNFEKLAFMDNYVCIIGSSNNYYHKYGCEDLDTTTFRIYNTNAAIGLGFSPCPKCKGNTSTSTTQNTSYTVYITKTGSKYHKSTCSYLSQSKIAIDKNEAISQGYTPCSVCNP